MLSAVRDIQQLRCGADTAAGPGNFIWLCSSPPPSSISKSRGNYWMLSHLTCFCAPFTRLLLLDVDLAIILSVGL